MSKRREGEVGVVGELGRELFGKGGEGRRRRVRGRGIVRKRRGGGC